ncbi:BOS complex subunit NCLN [Phlebotomus argentipes]|uniref:BOS complex subunit NCLN n=1 Tax=Phlebotomus argentipes TaxID=94469 RepID=UPI002892B167|nr:BOS complex subunit NCLN [Phlebotomus argentipes]
MFEEADNFADIFRGGLPYYLLITLPILIICSSNPVLASSEFSVQRMAQFDVHGTPYGCRASALNLEAKSLHTWTTSRHCVVTRFQDLTIDQFREIRAKAGGLVLLLPQDLSTLSADDRQHILLLEQAMMTQEVSIPVYFSTYEKKLEGIISDVTASSNTKPGQRETALTEIMSLISANGYQIVVSGASHTANKQSKIPIIQGELAPAAAMHKAPGDSTRGNTVEINPKLPLIIITAHLDTFGLLNEHLGNLDVAVFLTLMDLFSKLHSTVSTAPKYRLLFLLSESGSLLNFQGMKKWLDTNADENVQIQNAEFVLCLDSVGLSDSSTFFMHVSKPPKEGTHMNNFYKHLKVAAQRFGNVTVEGVHKKINLADLILAWEHERFSMKRMPAFTLSSLKSHKDPLRTTIFTDSSPSSLEVLERYTKILAEALASYIYNLNEAEIFTGSMAVTQNSLRPWLGIRSTLQNNDLKNAFQKYLKNVKITYEKPDAREPDFMLYEGQEGLLNIYSVKPAVFDLFLTFLIAAYLGAIYCVIIYFPKLYRVICKWSRSKVKVN